MKRSVFFQVAVCSVLAIGCSRGNDPLKWHAAEGKVTPPPTPTQERQMTPEFVISHMESPEETASYLKELAKDSKFDPKQHADMLKQYAGDSNPQVAAAAKELAERAQ
jgi:hypothetical protein